MRVLILGKNAKETAAAMAMERMGNEVLVHPGAPDAKQFWQSVEQLPEKYSPLMDTQEVIDLYNPELILCCEEAMSLSGVVDQLQLQDQKLFAPDKKAAKVLQDKPLWNKWMADNNVPVAAFSQFSSYDDVYAYIQENEAPYVFKEYTGEKRFAIPYSREEAQEILDLWFSDGNTQIMISDFLDGKRFNIPALIDGDQVVPLKTIYVDRGIYEEEDDAQAQGMGAVCCMEEVVDKSVRLEAFEKILKPLASFMVQNGTPYTGFINAECVDTDEGPLCVNLKAGLSETGMTALCPLLKSDLALDIQNLMEGNPTQPEFLDRACVSIVMAAKGYPGEISKGVPITIDKRSMEGMAAMNEVREEDGKLFTDGGRVLIVSATDADIPSAAEKALETANHVQCEDLFYRTDIGREIE